MAISRRLLWRRHEGSGLPL
ncbi:hypothetical protein CCACVL1_23219 [Corchorus capsularis]|uniref:Uncharacterized protein n=1 Tax=Corchorus capsularis TaxID=210143 RepID=A0A1R3GV00_COCAP|nr:hypothetical protein CCACVL1_23219 [Corchorus capsularis]